MDNQLYCIKRDGTRVEFTNDKILKAITKANNAIKEAKYKIKDKDLIDITDKVVKHVQKLNRDVNVEEIQDIVCKTLSASKYKEVAELYIDYREKRNRQRQKNMPFLKNFASKILAQDIENQNANVDERSFGGRKGEAESVIAKQYALDYLMSPLARSRHLNNQIYTHDLDAYSLGMHNCLSVPFDDLLSKGFNTRQTSVRPANSIGTALQLVAVIFQLQSLQQFGGVSATHLDWTLVPYLKKSFVKYYIKAYMKDSEDFLKLDLLNISDDDFDKWLDEHKETFYTKTKLKDKDICIDNKKELNKKYYQEALFNTRKELYQATEGLYHNLNTLQSRSGNQLPFTSINYGTCTSSEGRMIIRALLDCSIKGVGKNHRTPIFPCGIFQCMKGVNRKPGEPNYDLYRLALESTAKRIYPNYANVDWTVNAGYDKKDPKTYFSTMGALSEKEHLYIKIKDKQYDISIKDFYEYCKTGKLNNARPCQIWFNKDEADNKVSANRKVQTKTGERPEGGVYAITYIPEDVTYIGSTSNICRRFAEHKTAIKLAGKTDAGPVYGDNNLDHYKFEVLEYTEDYEEAENRYIQKIPNINVKGINQGYYKNLHTTKTPIYKRPNFKQDLTIPQDLINIEDKDIKVLDRGNKWVKVKHIFKNDKHNTPLMMHIIYLENGKKYELSCTEDHPLWTGKQFTRADKLTKKDKLYRADGKVLDIVDICWHWEPCDSYDIGTATGSFIGSDIIMHNCRTSNGADVNAEKGVNPQTKDGRGNIAPVTIILPTLAMECKEELQEKGEYTKEEICNYFLGKLSKRIEESKDILIERFEYICSQSPASAKFMYENNTFMGYHPEEGIRSALRHGTLVIGQLGLAEALQLLIDCDHTTNEGMEMAKRIEKLFNDKCKEYKNEYKLNFGVYFTPAENLCFTALKKFRDKYGVIPKVSDRDYFTNSTHVPVWYDLTPFEKIDIEAQLTGYSNAGCITYVELDGTVNYNIDALEKLVNYAMDKDIPYFAINIPIDTCLDCNFTGEFNDECPICHSKNIEQLRRVTGYLTGSYKEAFNYGKQKETEQRHQHVGSLPISSSGEVKE